MLTKRFLYGLTLLTIVACIAAGLVQYNRWAGTIRNVDEELVFPELADEGYSLLSVSALLPVGDEEATDESPIQLFFELIFTNAEEVVE